MAWMFGWTKKAIFATTATLTLGVSAGLGTAVYFASKVEQPGDKFIIKGVVDKAMLFNDLEKELSSKSFAELKNFIENPAAGATFGAQKVFDKDYNVNYKDFFTKEQAWNALAPKLTTFQGDKPSNLANGTDAKDLMIWDDGHLKTYYVFDNKIFTEYNNAAEAWANKAKTVLGPKVPGVADGFEVNVQVGGIKTFTINKNTLAQGNSVDFSYKNDADIAEDIIRKRITFEEDLSWNPNDQSVLNKAGVLGQIPFTTPNRYKIFKDAMGNDIDVNLIYSIAAAQIPDFNKDLKIEAIAGSQNIPSGRNSVIQINWESLKDAGWLTQKSSDKDNKDHAANANYKDMDYFMPVQVPTSDTNQNLKYNLVNMKDILSHSVSTTGEVRTPLAERDYSKIDLDPSYIDVGQSNAFTQDSLYDALIAGHTAMRQAKNTKYNNTALDFSTQSAYDANTNNSVANNYGFVAGSTGQNVALLDPQVQFITQKLSNVTVTGGTVNTTNGKFEGATINRALVNHDDEKDKLYLDWQIDIMSLLSKVLPSKAAPYGNSLTHAAQPIKYHPADWMTGKRTSMKDFYDAKNWVTGVTTIPLVSKRFELEKFDQVGFSKFTDWLAKKENFNKVFTILADSKKPSVQIPLKLRITSLNKNLLFEDFSTSKEVILPNVFYDYNDYNQYFTGWNVDSTSSSLSDAEKQKLWYREFNQWATNIAGSSSMVKQIETGKFTTAQIVSKTEQRTKPFFVLYNGVKLKDVFDMPFIGYGHNAPGTAPTVNDVTMKIVSITKLGISIPDKVYEWTDYKDDQTHPELKIESIASHNVGIKDASTYSTEMFEVKTFDGYLYTDDLSNNYYYTNDEDGKNSLLDKFIKLNMMEFQGAIGTEEHVKRLLVNFLLQFSVQTT